MEIDWIEILAIRMIILVAQPVVASGRADPVK